MILVLMGVSGSGKSTVGHLLASQLAWPFVDGDDLHPQFSVEKMSRGIALTDADRWPWLERVRNVMREHAREHQNLIVACSALKQEYRDYLNEESDVTWIYLTAPAEVLRERLEKRRGHFMKANMLPSQLDALEEPKHALKIDVAREPSEVVQSIVEAIGRQ